LRPFLLNIVDIFAAAGLPRPGWWRLL
jgi:hypothetical protein